MFFSKTKKLESYQEKVVTFRSSRQFLCKDVLDASGDFSRLAFYKSNLMRVSLSHQYNYFLTNLGNIIRYIYGQSLITVVVTLSFNAKMDLADFGV